MLLKLLEFVHTGKNMKPLNVFKIASVLLATLLLPQLCMALEMPAIFAYNMVLQQKQLIPVWGKAQPKSKVTITFADQTFSGKADKAGKWMIKLPAHPANSVAQKMIVNGDGKTLTFENILIGEVWVCSGQSNMQWNVKNSNDSAKEIASATDSLIRLCTVARSVADTPQDDAAINWDVCTPQTVPGFTAVGYFFGRETDKIVASGVMALPAGSPTLRSLVEQEDASIFVDSVMTMNARLMRSLTTPAE